MIAASKWSGGYAEWIEGDTAYLSVVFTWKLDHAFMRALSFRAFGHKVRVGGPALFQAKMQHELAELDGVTIGGDYPDAVAKHNAAATVASRGCPEGCSFCIVTPMEGAEFTLIPDFPVRPVLCDNNLSALPAEYQDHIIRRYQDAGVPLIDANSGFEPKTFTPDVYARWKPLIGAGGGPWRFAYDEMHGPHGIVERREVLRVMRMLADEPAKRKRVYVLIGNEPFADCMQRIQEVIDAGCEPHVQPVMKLVALSRDELWIRHDWTEERLRDVARWANKWIWRTAPFSEYVRGTRSRPRKSDETYDQAQGLFV